jgi:diguanylate cyclase (GGDEF)-like protein
MIGMVWLGIWYQIHSEYGQAEQSAQRDLQNYSRVFEEHIVRTVRDLDKALLIARRQYLEARQNMSYEHAIGLKLPDPTLLSDMSFQMATIDRHGTLTATTIGKHPPDPIDLSDREHFQVHKGARPDIPFISKPVLGRKSGRWSVQLTRRIEGPGGTFDGVLVASMDPEHFGRFYGSIDFGKDDAVILAGLDGIVRVSNGSETLNLGDKIENGVLLAAAANGNGFYRGDMDGSGSERMYALRHMENQPLFVAVGTSPSAVFGAVEKNRNRYIIAGTAVSLLILLAVMASIKHHTTIARMARHDYLTGLSNRFHFREQTELAHKKLGNEESLAILCLDLDRFKTINDTLGHPIGDKLLCIVAERLRGELREDDIIGRFGGDEFVIVQTGSDQPVSATALSDRIIRKISEPYEIDGHQVISSTSIGICIAPLDGTDPDELLKNADVALYRAKQEARGTYRFFETEMDTLMQQRRKMESDLRHALTMNEFELHYQPQLNLKTNEISGFEALLRWNHPERSIPPGEFIPLAEEIGLIIPIGKWVLSKACMEAAQWPGSYNIAVNLSPLQFKDPHLVETVREALKSSGLAPERLELEINETVLLSDTPAVLTTLHQFHDLGVRVALDDFGAGYSSLSCLRRFPFDKIKIDRSFVNDLGPDRRANAIIRAVTGLSASLGMITTAEGIETVDQLMRVRQEGCTEVQGLLIGRPKPVGEIAGLIHAAEYPQKETVVQSGTFKQ